MGGETTESLAAESHPAVAEAMSPSRRGLINAFLLLTISALLLSLACRHEFWPICNYPMFDYLDEHPDADSVEFYVQAPGEQEEWVLQDATVGKLHQEFSFKQILINEGWPSAKAQKQLLSVLQNMRKDRAPSDPAWAGPLTVRAYLVHYRLVRTGKVALQVTGRDPILQLTDPQP